MSSAPGEPTSPPTDKGNQIFERAIRLAVRTKSMNVLISGVGIAGPTLAFWLNKYGITPTLVELAPAL